MKTRRKILSLLLCGAMLFSLCAQPVFAEAGAQEQVNNSENGPGHSDETKEAVAVEGAEVLEELSLWFNNQTAPAAETASGDFDGGFHWTLDEDGTLTITGTGAMPNHISWPWLASYNNDIKKVVLGDGVTSIGDSAFFRCANLVQAELPDGLTSIGKYAFQECSSLALTELPHGLTSIGGSAFYRCPSLALTELPEGLTSIEDSTFWNCTNLALTKLPGGLTSIGDSAFSGCSSLALTKLPDSLTSIGENAFCRCTGLALTELPDGLTSIEDFTFQDCANLALTKLPAGLNSIGEWAFSACTNLALTELPDSLTSIGDRAFSGCSSLALTALPDNLTSIRDATFSGCTGLALTELPANVTSIGGNAFYRCSSLALTKLPDSLTSIGIYAFQLCTGLVQIELPDSISSIRTEAFQSCTSLTEIIIPRSYAPTLGTNVFSNCPALTAIYVPAGANGYTVENNWPEDKIKSFAAPSFTLQPQDAAVTTGKTAVFTITASGGPAPACQWQISKDGSTWEDIPDATGSSYTIEAADKSMDGWSYRCVASNKSGSAASDAATLTVKSTDASLQSVFVGGTAGTVSGTEVTVVLPYGATPPTDSSQVSIIPATGAAVSALATADSGATWTFTVTAEDQATTAAYTIKVSNAPDPAAGNSADVAAAKSMIEKYSWAAGQADANTKAEVQAWIENQLNGMGLNGIGCTVSITGFTAAVAGSEANKNGTDGSFSFTVSLSKGVGNTLAEDTAVGISGTITATPYQAQSYSISVSASPTEGGTVSGGGIYTENTSVTVTASARDGYHFVKWTEGGNGVSATADYRFTVTGSRTLAAVFEKDTLPQPARYSVTVNGSYAAASGAGSYEAGVSVSICAGSRSNYRFDGWTSPDGVVFASAGDASTSFTMPDQAVTVTATWVYTGDGSGDSGPSYGSKTLTSGGVTLFGGYIHEYARLTVTKDRLHDSGDCRYCGQIRQWQAQGRVVAIYDVSLSHGFLGTVTITFPVPDGYNGKTLTVAHCLKDRLDTCDVTVSDGKATVTADSLSPFAILDNPKNGPGKDNPGTAGRSVTVRTQTQLDAALTDPEASSIVIKTGRNTTFKVKAGDYDGKKLVISAPNATVNNYGSFKKISVHDGRIVYDRGASNTIVVRDRNMLKLVAGKQSYDSDIKVTLAGAQIVIVNNGRINGINVSGMSTVTVRGKAKEAPAITANAAGAQIVAAMDASIVLNEPANLTVKSGSTIGLLTAKADSTIKVEAGATVNTLVVDGADTKVALSVDGRVDKIVVEEKSAIMANQTLRN